MRFSTFPVLLAAFLCALPLAAPAAAQDREDRAAADSLGYFRFLTDIDSVWVVVDRDYEGFYRIAAGDSITLPAGKHAILVANSQTYDHSFFVHVEPDSTTNKRIRIAYSTLPYELLLKNSSYPALYAGANLRVYTDPDSEILVDGRRIGRGFAALDTLSGTYTVRTVHPLAGTKEQRVVLKSDPPRLIELEMYNKPVRSGTYLAGVIPGLSQFYKNQKRKAVVLVGAFAAGSGVSSLLHWSFLHEQEDYLDILAAYRSEREEAEALRLGDLADARYGDVVRSARTRDVLIGLTLGLYALNVIDAWISPEEGYRGKTQRPDFRLAPALGTGGAGVRLHYRY